MNKEGRTVLCGGFRFFFWLLARRRPAASTWALQAEAEQPLLGENGGFEFAGGERYNEDKSASHKET